MTPAARTLAECRRRGWICQVVERTIGRTFIKQDLFGCIDVVAVAPNNPKAGGYCDQCADHHGEPSSIIGIQATTNTGGQHAKHLAKILAEPRIKAWIEAGGRMLLWTWAKQGARGKRKLWTLREQEVTLDDYEHTKSKEQAA